MAYPATAAQDCAAGGHGNHLTLCIVARYMPAG
jgi:hypothetical protein